MTNPKKSRLIVVLIIVLAVTATSAWAKDPQAKIVGMDWLKNNPDRSDIRIVDVKNSVTDYWQGHIPGAASNIADLPIGTGMKP